MVQDGRKFQRIAENRMNKASKGLVDARAAAAAPSASAADQERLQDAEVRLKVTQDIKTSMDTSLNKSIDNLATKEAHDNRPPSSICLG